MTQWNDIYKKEGKNYSHYDILEPHEEMKQLSKIFKKNNVKNILDLGCGAGRNLLYLSEQGFDVVGVDNAKEGLKILKKELKKKKLKSDLFLGNVFSKLPFGNNFFDAVISVQVLQHSTEKNIIKSISEIRRILKKDGLVFITLAGRIACGKVRYCLVKTAKEIAPNTFKPTIGNEKGLTHFIYNQKLIKKHFKDFRILDLYKDKKDYYCVFGKNK
ncbi:MAG: methyltransferase domain-containing protein [Nanoarchaeota archaeon]|nr:methyltransferase domain-containing protein [Nanoarchaeota archaeon]MBU1029711.1 methyltransferase domain-containing protein [Nanoarchaeota archaeon]MBU1850116.1 methyltransferase domain-containing protein [Nanoarchaeota archaeon]